MGFLRRWSQKVSEATSSTDGRSIIPDGKESHMFRNSLKRLRYAAEDWVYLAALGSIMALVSLWMDWVIERLNEFHYWAYDYVSKLHSQQNSLAAMFVIWVGYMVVLVVVSALIAHYIAPQAIGSGIPEMKTILRGVILKEYLTFRTLFTKIAGLTLALGSGLPIGKEGPFVHISSIVASQLSRLIHGFKGIYENESRSSEMLAAGCAVGVACTFSAPIGGVLFSIEVTSVFFAVRNYWRGFFAAACSATITRIILPILKDPELDMNAYFQTHFPPGKAFVLEELPFFAILGVICGFLAALFILLHRTLVLFLRRNTIAKRVFQRYWLIYPILVAILVGIITFPEGFGQYMAGKQKFTRTVSDLFQNCTWSAPPGTPYACDSKVTQNWSGKTQTTPVFTSLWGFSIVFYFLSILCTTVPIPAGIFMPVFVLGAAFGRLTGEYVSVLCGGVIASVGKSHSIYPGVYSVVGTAAFAGAVTHTVSVAVIIFEVTGQLLYLLPVMIAVIISNAVCSYFQPSIFDSIIRMKHLPYLPDIRSTSSVFHTITVDRVMVRQVQFISRETTYRQLQYMLLKMHRLRAFPIVDSINTMSLLGSVSRNQLERILDEKIGDEARHDEANRRIKCALEEDSNLLNNKSRFTVQLSEEQHEQTPSELREKEAKNIQLKIESILGAEEKKAHDDGFHLHPALGGIIRSITRNPFHLNKTTRVEPAVNFDLWGDERIAWENAQLTEMIHLDDVPIDPSPFQLVAHTSLFKLHSLFSLLGLNRAYVTQHGMLVGVIALREVRDAIERATNGLLFPMDDNEHSDNGITMNVPQIKISMEMDTLSPPPRDIYDDDHSDYEDNLQGRLEVVPSGSRISDDEEDAVPPFAFSINSMRSSIDTPFSYSLKKDPTHSRRLLARRDSQRMDEMTTTRRRSSIGITSRRNSFQPSRRYLPDTDDDVDSTLESPLGLSFKTPFDKSYASNLGVLREETPVKVEIEKRKESFVEEDVSETKETDESKPK